MRSRKFNDGCIWTQLRKFKNKTDIITQNWLDKDNNYQQDCIDGGLYKNYSNNSGYKGQSTNQSGQSRSGTKPAQR